MEFKKKTYLPLLFASDVVWIPLILLCQVITQPCPHSAFTANNGVSGKLDYCNTINPPFGGSNAVIATNNETNKTETKQNKKKIKNKFFYISWPKVFRIELCGKLLKLKE